MAWNFVGSVQLNFWIEPQLINLDLRSNRIIIKAESSAKQLSWRRAGWIQQAFIYPETGITVNPIRRRVYFDTQILEFKGITLVESYKVQFMLVGWLPFVTLSFWDEK